MSSPSPADDSQNAPKKNTEAPGIMKFFKSLGKTNSDECAEHVKTTATFSALGTAKQKEKIAPKARKKSKTVPRVTRSRRRVKPAARNAKKPKVSRGSSEGPDKDSVYDILDISDDAEEVTIIEYSEFLKQQQISKETKNDACGNAKAPVEETAITEQVQKTAPVSVITGYFKPISEEPQSEGKAKRPSHGKVKLSDLTSSRPKRACTMLRNSFDALQQEMLLEMFDRKARRNLCKVDVLESQHPMRLRHKRDSFEQFFVPPEEEPTKSPRSSKHKKKKRSKSQSEVAQTLAEHENTNEVYTSTIIEERSDFKCPRLRITRVSKDHDDTVKDPVDDLEAQDIVCVKEEVKDVLTDPKPEVAQVDEARVSFLQSGIPEKLRRQTDAANAVLEEFIRDSANFPTVSHVRQLTDDIQWTLPKPEMAHLKTTLTSIPTIAGKLELGSFTQCKRSERWQPQPTKPFDQQQVLTTLQQEHPKLAIVKMFERYQHRTRVSQNSQNANSVTEEVDRIAVANNKGKVAARGKRSRRGTARPNSKRNSVNVTDLNNQHADEVSSNSSSTGDESSLMWTEKFQPEGAIDIIGNDRAVQELRSWLHHWKQKPRQDDPAVRVPKRKRTDSATDEDYVADEFCHAQLLVGPTGIGKTATVYALANEIGFEVIEVNASSKRAGKQVLSQLQEATQSHSVNNGPSCDHQGIANYFQKVNNKPANSQQQDKSNLKKKYPMGSLILFKDVDIVFEEDEGFINAVNSFIDISKRPIIMTTSDQRFVIANRLSAIHEEIRFEVPNWDLVILHMQLMSLAEGLHVPAEELMSTTPPWKIDIRHAILALQYRYMSATKPQIAEATVVKEPAGNSQRRRKRPTKQQAVQSPPTDTCKDTPAEDATRWDLPRDATLQTGRILTLTTGKVTDNIVGVCWSSGINFTMGPSKHVLDQDGTNNTSPGDTVRVDGKRSAASSTLLSEFADRASALDVIQWQALRQTPDVATNASRDFVRPGTSDVAVYDDSESWCTKACGQDISAYLRTLNWENFSKLQRDSAESHDGGVHMQWTRDTLQTQISKARKDVGAVVKQCSLQASHALDLDYMPWLKVICRAEGIRHVSNKKRGGGRYLHYLDSINLSLQPGTLSHLTNS